LSQLLVLVAEGRRGRAHPADRKRNDARPPRDRPSLAVDLRESPSEKRRRRSTAALLISAALLALVSGCGASHGRPAHATHARAGQAGGAAQLQAQAQAQQAARGRPRAAGALPLPPQAPRAAAREVSGKVGAADRLPASGGYHVAPGAPSDA